jgi:hypothetical protein
MHSNEHRHTITEPATRRGRALRALAAVLAIVAVSLTASAPRASAASYGPACNYDNSFNACLRLDIARVALFNPVVGIDVHLPEQYAREIVACGADFKASLWGWDNGGSEDDFIANMVISPGWPAGSSTGLSSEFFLNYVDSNRFDEDEGTDELYARISYWDCHNRQTQKFRTGIITSEFWF